jgi:predicted Zn finger-like uncharacterized protein
MLTQCPKCKAVFRITQNQLKQARGKVRCGQCSSVFDGTDNRSDQLLSTTKTHIDARREEHITAQQTRKEEQEYGVDHIPLPDLIAEQDPEEHQANPASEEPWQQILLGIPQSGSITNPNPPKRSLASASLFIVITLALLLLGQFTFFNRDHLNRHFPLRGVISDICNFIGCATEPVRDINRIEITNRNVSAHPSIPEALMIRATFANIAPFPQPYPILQISLTNLQGKVIAARRFSPQDYLSGTQTSTKLMPPGQPVNASIEVLDPGNGVVAFEFQFY